MTTLTAKEIRRIVCSVETSRRLGIPTAIVKTAPDVLAQAEVILDEMFNRANKLIPSAPSMSKEYYYFKAAGAAVAYQEAVEELRKVLA